MRIARWWKKWPGRLKYELRALRDAGATYEHDRDALRAGFIRLKLKWPIDAGFMNLVVVFPDLYPYFRFEVQAPDEDLPYHQHAHGKNLCLIGRATSRWEVDDTVAGLLRLQLHRVLGSARSITRGEVAGVEQRQAEPFSDYYPCAPSIALIDGSWSIPTDVTSGFLRIGLLAPHAAPAEPLLRGVVLDVQENTERSLCKADVALREVFSHSVIRTRWVWAPEPIKEFDAEKFFEHVRNLDRGHNQNPWHVVKGGRIQIYGVHFPEEVDWRESARKGWIFVVRYEQDHVRTNTFMRTPSKRKGR